MDIKLLEQLADWLVNFIKANDKVPVNLEDWSRLQCNLKQLVQVL